MASIGSIKEKKAALNARAARFAAPAPALATKEGGSILKRLGGTPVEHRDNITLSMSSRIKGKSTALEKPYLRLTGEADRNQIRPENVLKLALEQTKKRYTENEDYSYFCEQLKSIRQDLTVQNKQGPFCAHVYETHARVALLHGDLGEYNQCQSRLLELRARGTCDVKGKLAMSVDEFDCYRLLYCLHVGDKLDLTSVLREIQLGRGASGAQHAAPATNFALAVVQAVKQGNSWKFFELYRLAREQGGSTALVAYVDPYDARVVSKDKRPAPVSPAAKAAEAGPASPQSSSRSSSQAISPPKCYQACYIMDFLLLRQRLHSLHRMLKSYITVSLPDMYAQLLFPNPSDGLQFVHAQQLVLVAPTAADAAADPAAVPHIDCRASLTARTAALASASAIVSAEPAREGGSGSSSSSITDRIGAGKSKRGREEDSLGAGKLSKKQRKALLREQIASHVDEQPLTDKQFKKLMKKQRHR